MILKLAAVDPRPVTTPPTGAVAFPNPARAGARRVSRKLVVIGLIG